MGGYSRSVKVVWATVIAIAMLVSSATPVAAQYGGISGLFVAISPATPNQGSFSGLGCVGGEEVVLYFPALSPTANDPAASQTVPGRIVAVTTARSDSNGLLDGSFTFPNVQFPSELEPGTYEVRARCGDVDLGVLIRLRADGSIEIEPSIDGGSIDRSSGVPGALPFTGRSASTLLSVSAALVAAGIALLSLNRTQRQPTK